METNIKTKSDYDNEDLENKKIELSNEKACEILDGVEFRNSENEIKAIEAVSSYILETNEMRILLQNASHYLESENKELANDINEYLNNK